MATETPIESESQAASRAFTETMTCWYYYDYNNDISEEQRHSHIIYAQYEEEMREYEDQMLDDYNDRTYVDTKTFYVNKNTSNITTRRPIKPLVKTNTKHNRSRRDERHYRRNKNCVVNGDFHL